MYTHLHVFLNIAVVKHARLLFHFSLAHFNSSYICTYQNKITLLQNAVVWFFPCMTSLHYQYSIKTTNNNVSTQLKLVLKQAMILTTLNHKGKLLCNGTLCKLLHSYNVARRKPVRNNKSKLHNVLYNAKFSVRSSYSIDIIN